jgi:hypothetical protein
MLAIVDAFTPSVRTLRVYADVSSHPASRESSKWTILLACNKWRGVSLTPLPNQGKKATVLAQYAPAGEAVYQLA